MFNTHSGSWLGLPDFSITERISDALGRPRTNQGGSSILGNQGASNTQQNPSGEVAAMSSMNYNFPLPTNTNPNYQPTQNRPAAPTNQASTQNNVVPSVDPLLAEIDNAFNPTMNYLSGLESSLNSQLPSAENQVNQEYGVAAQSLTNQKQQGLSGIDTQETTARARKEDASSAARRLFGELQRQGMQRYGGASSAGQAFTELSSNEFQRNMGGIDKGFNETLTQIGAARTSVENKFMEAMNNIELQKNSALQSVRDDFRNKINEISRMRAGAQQEKANMRLQALQELRNQVFQVNMDAMNFARQLQSQREANVSYLENVAKSIQQNITSATNAGQNFAASTSTNPSTNITAVSNSGVDPFAPIGVRTGMRPEDELLRGVATTRRDLLPAL
jgi:hypothetical protein